MSRSAARAEATGFGIETLYLDVQITNLCQQANLGPSRNGAKEHVVEDVLRATERLNEAKFKRYQEAANNVKPNPAEVWPLIFLNNGALGVKAIKFFDVVKRFASIKLDQKQVERFIKYHTLRIVTALHRSTTDALMLYMAEMRAPRNPIKRAAYFKPINIPLGSLPPYPRVAHGL